MNMEEMLKWLTVMIVLLLVHAQTVGNIEPQGWNLYRRQIVKRTVGKSKVNERNIKNQLDDSAEVPKHNYFRNSNYPPQGQGINLADDYKFKVRKHPLRQDIHPRQNKRRTSDGLSQPPEVAEDTPVSELHVTAKSTPNGFDEYEKTLDEISQATVSSIPHTDDQNEKTLEEISEDVEGNPCVTSPCANGGTCHWNQNQYPSFTCTCKLGYTGSKCEQEVRECDHVPCKDRGQCVATPSGFLCLCREGYGGKFCETEGTNRSSLKVNIGDGFVISRNTVETVYSTVIFLGSVFGIIVFILCIHCCRVYNKRAVFLQEFENLLKDGEEITSLPPGIIDVSNELCREFWCCGCCDMSDSIKVYKELDVKKSVDDLKSKNVKRSRSGKAERRPLVKRSSHRNSSSSQGSIPLDNRLSMSERAIPTLERSSVQSFASLPSTIHEPRKRLSWLPEEVTSSSSDDSLSISRSKSKRGSSRILPHVGSRSSSSYKNQNANYQDYRQNPSCDEFSETSFDSHQISTKAALNHVKNECYYNNSDAQQSMMYQTNNYYSPQQSGQGMTDSHSQAYPQYPTLPAPQYPYR